MVAILSREMSWCPLLLIGRIWYTWDPFQYKDTMDGNLIFLQFTPRMYLKLSTMCNYYLKSFLKLLKLNMILMACKFCIPVMLKWLEFRCWNSVSYHLAATSTFEYGLSHSPHPVLMAGNKRAIGIVPGDCERVWFEWEVYISRVALMPWSGQHLTGLTRLSQDVRIKTKVIECIRCQSWCWPEI